MNEKKFNFKIILKAGVIGVLLLLMLIPLSFVKGVVKERSNYKNDAFKTISGSWGKDQLIAAPFLNVPYSYIYQEKDKDGKIKDVKRYGIYKISPSKLEADVKIVPQVRYIGIFKLPVYTAEVTLKGAFGKMDDTGGRTVDLSKTQMTIEVADLKGVAKLPEGSFNNRKLDFAPYTGNNAVLFSSVLGSDEDYKNIAVLTKTEDSMRGHYKEYGGYGSRPGNQLKAIGSAVNYSNASSDFEVKFALRGSNTINFVPAAKENKFIVKSSWKDPLFFNSFLPDSKTISSDGFSAEWNISYLASGIAQMFESLDITPSIFGVKLSMPVDNYRNGLRSVKYGILFLSLTFLACFVFEIAGKMPIHPFQYLLVGLAMAVFYLLLVSISEFIPFGWSYMIASAAVVLMVGGYARYGVIKKQGAKYFWVPAGIIAVLYMYLYVLLQLQDLSLLLGSLGLFLGLGAVMYTTRNINWYE